MKSVARLMLLLLTTAPFAAGAQERQREGFGSSYGPALVGVPIQCDICSGKSFGGIGGYLRLGRYLRPDLFVGVEADLHTLPVGNSRYDAHFFSLAMQWYPKVERGFYIKGSLGMARLVDLDQEDDFEVRRTLNAPALGISVGYDIRTRRRFLVTPFASAAFLTGADYKENGRVIAKSATGRAFQIGLGFTWY